MRLHAEGEIKYRNRKEYLPLIDINYSITLRTEYQQQMNDLVTPFATKPGGVNYIIIEQKYQLYLIN